MCKKRRKRSFQYNINLVTLKNKWILFWLVFRIEYTWQCDNDNETGWRRGRNRNWKSTVLSISHFLYLYTYLLFWADLDVAVVQIHYAYVHRQLISHWITQSWIQSRSSSTSWQTQRSTRNSKHKHRQNQMYQNKDDTRQWMLM